MSDISALKGLGIVRREEVALRRKQAAADFQAAVKLAHAEGLCIIQRSEAHYQLFPHGKEWCINLYPGNQHVLREKAGQHLVGKLDVGFDWTLEKAILATVEMLAKRGAK